MMPNVSKPEKPRILLVLDDPKLAQHVVSFLGGNGFEALAYKTGVEVLESIQRVRPDAVVASQLLPGMDGVTLTKNVLKETSKVKVVLLAAVGSPAGIQDVKKTSGADAVLGRGFKPEQLLKEIQRVLGLLPPKNAKSGASAAAKQDSGSAPVAQAPPVTSPSPVSVAPVKPAPVMERAVAPAPLAPDLGFGDEVSDLSDFMPLDIEVAPPPPAAATADIEAALRWATEPAGPASPVAPAPEHPLPQTAPITPFEPAWMLSRAFADNVSGALRFLSGAVERTVFLDHGRPLVATSNVPEERIGAMLVARGKLTPLRLTQLLDASKSTGRKLAELVVQSGAITEEERFAIVAEQYAERILSLFSWHQASIEFHARPVPAEEIAIQLPTERLLMEGLRRHYDMHRLEACLTDPNRVLSLLPGAEARLPSLALTPLEHDTFIFVDGHRTLAQVAEVAPVRLEALRILYGGVCLNLLG